MSQLPSGRWIQHDQIGETLYIQEQTIKRMAMTLKWKAANLKVAVPPEVDSFFEHICTKASLMRIKREKKMEAVYKKLDKVAPLER